MGKENYNEDIEIDLEKCGTVDITGLIPSLPQSKAERESYKSIAHYQTGAKQEKRDGVK